MTKIEFEASSGNVFADLGICDPEEALIQADLALEIGRHIAEQGWTQTHAAKVLGIQQSDVSNIVRGRLKGFSIERLVKMLRLLGQTVKVVVADREHTVRQNEQDVFSVLDELIPDTLETRTVGAQEWLRLKLTEVMTEARRHVSLTQAQLAARMGVQVALIKELESANSDRALDGVVAYLTAVDAELLVAVRQGAQILQASRDCWLVDVPNVMETVELQQVQAEFEFETVVKPSAPVSTGIEVLAA